MNGVLTPTMRGAIYDLAEGKPQAVSAATYSALIRRGMAMPVQDEGDERELTPAGRAQYDHMTTRRSA